MGCSSQTASKAEANFAFAVTQQVLDDGVLCSPSTSSTTTRIVRTDPSVSTLLNFLTLFLLT